MTQRSWKSLVLPGLVATAVALPTLGNSAEIERIDGGVCTIALTGEIVPGDAQALWDTDPKNGDVLCLNSPGGNFAEAIKIADRLDGGVLATRLEAGSECMSACALIFVAASWFEDIHVPRRSMHQDARLGFHAPFVIPPKGQYTEQSISDAFKIGTNAVALMMRLGTIEGRFGYEGVFPNDIMIEILGKGPNEFYEVDRPERANALGIEIVGIRAPDWTQKQVCTACDHWFEMSRFPNSCTNVVKEKLEGNRTLYRVQGYEAEAMAECVVRVAGDQSTAEIRTYGLWPGENVEDAQFQTLAPWYAYAKTGDSE